MLQISIPNTVPDAQSFSLCLEVALPSDSVTVIFGPSGSGKTSLLRCIAGLDKLPSAQVSANNLKWQDERSFVPVNLRSLGFVFQEASLFEHLTVQKNLEYAIKRAKKTQKFNYNAVVDVLGIRDFLDKYPSALSGGERQRVAIARALLCQPELLLMDEPLASLDAQRKQEVITYIEAIIKQFHIGVVYVTHSLYELTRLADYVVLLNQGKIVEQGELNTVLEHLHAHAASLEMNKFDAADSVLAGEVIDKETQWGLNKVAITGGELYVEDHGEELGSQVRLRISPSDLSVTLNKPHDSSMLNILQATILELHDDTPSTQRVKLQVGRDILFARITRKSIETLRLKQGIEVFLQLKSAAVIP